MAGQIPEQEKSPTPDAFAKRKEALFRVLTDIELRASMPDSHLEKEWLDEPVHRFDQAVARGQRWGQRSAFVIQFSQVNIDYNRRFVDTYFRKLGAHVTTPDGGRLAVTGGSLPTIAASQNLPHMEIDVLSGDRMNKIPSGSLLVKSTSDREYLIVETDIEGVRIIMNGSAVDDPHSNVLLVSPSFIVRIDDAPTLKIKLPEDEKAEKEVMRRTWREVHGRESGVNKAGITEHDRETWYPKLLKGTEEEARVAEAGLAWGMKAKSAEKIKVTPTRIKEKPFLESEQDRIEALRQALNMAVDNLKRSRKGQGGRSVVGMASYSLAIMTEVLGMTAKEIAKDGEAMSDLVEYLEEAACAVPGSYSVGHSSILGSPLPGDPFTEIAKEIKETWEFPESDMSNFPLMYKRIDWQKRSQSTRNN